MSAFVPFFLSMSYDIMGGQENLMHLLSQKGTITSASVYNFI